MTLDFETKWFLGAGMPAGVNAPTGEKEAVMAGTFRFSFGPWNIHEGADPFGPMVRDSIEFNEKIKVYKKRLVTRNSGLSSR